MFGHSEKHFGVYKNVWYKFVLFGSSADGYVLFLLVNFVTGQRTKENLQLECSSSEPQEGNLLLLIQGASRETDVFEMDVTEQVQEVEAWNGGK